VCDEDGICQCQRQNDGRCRDPQPVCPSGDLSGGYLAITCDSIIVGSECDTLSDRLVYLLTAAR